VGIAPISQEVTMTAMVAKNNIIILHIRYDANSICFLPQVGMSCTKEHTAWKIIQDSFFKPPNAIERAI
jgi:hypothetical protein